MSHSPIPLHTLIWLFLSSPLLACSPGRISLWVWPCREKIPNNTHFFILGNLSFLKSGVDQRVGHLHIVPLKTQLQHSIFGQSPSLPEPPCPRQRMRECCLPHSLWAGHGSLIWLCRINPAGPSTPWQLSRVHPKPSTSVLLVAHAFFWKHTSQWRINDSQNPIRKETQVPQLT